MRTALFTLVALLLLPLLATAQTPAAKINIAVTIVWVPRFAHISPEEFVVAGKPRHDLARYFATGRGTHTTYPVTGGPYSTTTDGQTSGIDSGTFVPGTLLGDRRGLVSFDISMSQTSLLLPGDNVRVSISLGESKLLPAETDTKRRYRKSPGFLTATVTMHNGRTQHLGQSSSKGGLARYYFATVTIAHR